MYDYIKKFIRRAIIFLYPIVILLSTAYCCLYLSGEILSIQKVYELQSYNNILYGPAYSSYEVQYKSYNITNKHYDTLIFGTSRVMQFDVNDFPGSTYNAGGIISNIGEYNELIEYCLQKDISPKKIIIGLDQYFFNGEWDKVNAALGNSEYLKKLLNNNTKPNLEFGGVILDIFKGKINIPRIIQNAFEGETHIGLNAIMNRNGFYPSGNYFYGGKYVYGKEHDRDFADTYIRILQGNSRFEYGEVVNEKAVKKLENFIEICELNDIEVIGIIPPYAPSVYNRMEETGNYDYLNKIYSTIYPIFREREFLLYDFTYMPNTTDDQYVDGFHGGDDVYELIAEEIIADY